MIFLLTIDEKINRKDNLHIQESLGSRFAHNLKLSGYGTLSFAKIHIIKSLEIDLHIF